MSAGDAPDGTRGPPKARAAGATWSPVTAVITREVLPGRASDYRDWVHRLLVAVARVPGYQGATLVGPPYGDPGRHMLILRFADRQSLHRWSDSDVRTSLTAESADFSRHVYDEPPSLETWFAIPGMGAVAPPPRWKMAVVTTPAAFVLISAILAVVAPVSESWPGPVVNAVVTVVMVALLTYLVMPGLTRVLHGWLYPQAARPGGAVRTVEPPRED